jgi:hypothetical protein
MRLSLLVILAQAGIQLLISRFEELDSGFRFGGPGMAKNIFPARHSRAGGTAKDAEANIRAANGPKASRGRGE